MSRSWKEKYFDKVMMSMLKYERLNRKAKTITREPTEEELAQYSKIQENIKYEQYCQKYDDALYGGY